MEISIRFEDYIPQELTVDEQEHLERSIIKEGCREPLAVWKNQVLADSQEYEYILIDGHNRLKICKEHDIEYETRIYDSFASEDDVKLWILDNQRARRNLTAYNRIRVELMAKDLLAEQAKERQGTRIDLWDTKKKNKDENSNIVSNLTPSSAPGKTRDKIAKAAGVSAGTVHKVEYIEKEADKVDSEIKEKARSGDISIDAAYQAVKKKDAVIATKYTGDDQWYTPSKYVDAARTIMGDIDLDPATCEFAQKTVKARQYFTSNALDEDWSGRVWLNPPYQMPDIRDFVDKLCDSFTDGDVIEAILLCNNATDTKWWHQAFHVSGLACLTLGRINFYKEDGSTSSPTNGQSFFYFGPQKAAFVRTFGEFGVIIEEAKK